MIKKTEVSIYCGSRIISFIEDLENNKRKIFIANHWKIKEHHVNIGTLKTESMINNVINTSEIWGRNDKEYKTMDYWKE